MELSIIMWAAGRSAVSSDLGSTLVSTDMGSLGEKALSILTPILYTSFGFLLNFIYERAKRRQDQELSIRTETRTHIRDLIAPLLDLMFDNCKWLLALETHDIGHAVGLRPTDPHDVAMNLESSLSKLTNFVKENRSTILLYLPKHFVWVFAKLEADIRSNILRPLLAKGDVSNEAVRNALLLFTDLEDDLRTVAGLDLGKNLRSVRRLNIPAP